MKKYEYDQKLEENMSRSQMPRLLEQAIKFFLENHMLDDIVQEDEFIQGDVVDKCIRAVYRTKNTCIEVKVPLIRGKQEAEPESDRQIDQAPLEECRRYCNHLQKHFKRVILLLAFDSSGVGQDEKTKLVNDLKKLCREEIGDGMEIWTADLEMEPDGVSLLSYRNETDSRL